MDFNPPSMGCFTATAVPARLSPSSDMGFQRINRGERFGRLTVLERTRLNKLRRVEYLVRCDCGHMLIVTRESLENGEVFSCGCSPKRPAPSRKAEPFGFEQSLTDFRERRVGGRVQVIASDGRVLDERPLTKQESETQQDRSGITSKNKT